MARLFLLIFLFSLNAYSQNCTEQFYNSSPTSTLDKTIFGKIKCNSLDRNTWEEGWKTPCDCLYQQDIGSKIRRRAYKKSEQRKLSSIDQRVEKKIADVFKTQIFTELEQALRLDIYLKKGVISTKNIGNGKDLSVPFPESCRIDKIDDLVKEINTKRNSTCKNPRFDDRLKLLFGEGGYDSWKTSQMKLFENTVMNKLSDEDRKNGMCVPYKTFLSFNSANNLRTTYLKVAKAKKLSFKDFQMWASDRRNPDDTSRIIASDEVREEVPSSMSGSALKLLQPGYGSSWMKKQTGALRLKLDDKSQIEPISNEDIQRLIKTDPIFERMIRDPQFFEAMTKENIESFNPNDPKIIKLISESQNKQCKNLYGTKNGNDKDAAARTRGTNKTKEENSLLMRYLCEENFPRDFIDENVITGTLAPEFKKELGLEDEQKATDYLVDYLYCQSKETKERNIPQTNGEISADFTSTFMGIPKNDDVKNLLNLSLNPKSDLEHTEANGDQKANGKNAINEYQKFNETTCKHIDEKCKQAGGDAGNASACSLSTLSRDIVEQILKERFPENELATIEKQIFDISLSDKEVRAILTEKGFFTKDQADSVITLRHQDQKFQWKEVAEDLKKETANRATGRIPPDGVDPVTYIFSHRHEIKADPNISDELKTRILEIGKLRSKNSIASETTNDDNASFFANYFVLADDKDEVKITANRGATTTPPPNIVGGKGSSNNPVETPVISGAGNAPSGSGGQVRVPQIGDGSAAPQVPETVYQRKAFGTSPTPPKNPDPIPPADNSRSLADNSDKGTPPAVTKKSGDDSLEKVATREQAITRPNANFGSGLVLTENGASRPRENSGDASGALEKERRDLEDRINNLNDEINKFENQDEDTGRSENPELSDLKKRLKDLIDEKRNGGGGNSGGSRRIGNSDNRMGNNNSFGNGWNSNGYFDGSNGRGGDSNQFNNGYGRGKEFINEQAKNELDNGGEEFDPESTKKNSEASGGGTAGSGGKGKAGGGGNVSLSSSGEGGDDSGDGAGGAGGKRKKRRGGSGPDDQELIAKCGTGPILKCVFPNSYFIDADEIKGVLYTTMANLKLEGRKFQTLEKMRKSRKDMRMGESSKAKYYLITYDLVVDKEKRQVTDEERGEIYNDIKENRKDPKFKKKLIKYRFMTKTVPPKILLSEKEAIDVINRTITPDEYKKLHILND